MDRPLLARLLVTSRNEDGAETRVVIFEDVAYLFADLDWIADAGGDVDGVGVVRVCDAGACEWVDCSLCGCDGATSKD